MKYLVVPFLICLSICAHSQDRCPELTADAIDGNINGGPYLINNTCNISFAPATFVQCSASIQVEEDGALTFDVTNAFPQAFTQSGGAITVLNETMGGSDGSFSITNGDMGAENLEIDVRSGATFSVGGTLTTGTSLATTLNIEGLLTVTGSLDMHDQTTLEGSGDLQAGSNITEADGAGTITDTDFFGSTTCGGTCASPLPVELLSFEGSLLNSSSRLVWSTASELNNEGFEIERSRNGADFEYIGFVEGNGTTNEIQEYSFNDHNVSINGYVYYRLKQIDFDGEFEYSPVISINTLQQASVALYPTRVWDKLTLVGEQDMTYQMTLLDMSGKERMITRDQISLVEINERLNKEVSSLNTGLYIIKLYSSAGKQVLKFIKS